MTDYHRASFGTLLHSFRKQRNLPQQEGADGLNIPRRTPGRWEQGDSLPGRKAGVLELARHLELDDQEARQLLEANLIALSPYWLVPYLRRA